MFIVPLLYKVMHAHLFENVSYTDNFHLGISQEEIARVALYNVSVMRNVYKNRIAIVRYCSRIYIFQCIVHAFL